MKKESCVWCFNKKNIRKELPKFLMKRYTSQGFIGYWHWICFIKRKLLHLK